MQGAAKIAARNHKKRRARIPQPVSRCLSCNVRNVRVRMFLSALGIAIKEKEPIRDPLVTGVGHQNLIDEQNQAVAFVRTDTRKVDPSVRSD